MSGSGDGITVLEGDRSGGDRGAGGERGASESRG